MEGPGKLSPCSVSLKLRISYRIGRFVFEEKEKYFKKLLWFEDDNPRKATWAAVFGEDKVKLILMDEEGQRYFKVSY